MIEGHLYLFPLSVCILIPLAYFLSSFLAVHLGHNKWNFSLFSQSTTDSPESCIYAQLINVASFILIITVYLRHRQITELIRNNPTWKIKYSRVNFIFLLFGTVAAFGMSIIANFPHVNVFVIRILALYITLITSVAALYCEMFLSYWIRPLLYPSRFLPILRTVLTMVCTIALIAFLTFQTMVIVQCMQTVKLETEGERGRFKSIGLVASLWLLTIALLIYISTLIPDFYRIKIMSPKIFLTNDVVDDRTNNLLTTSISM